MALIPNSIALYTSDDGTTYLQVSLEQDTVWLTQAQMIDLFERDQSVISRHINNVFKDQELEKESNMQKMHIANSDKPVALYSLDVIISVGYRVKSQRGVKFRQWATRVLNQYLVDGYTLNQRRLQERGIEFEQALKLLSQTLTNQQLINSQGEEVISVINDYARSWSLLQGYDEQSLAAQGSKQGDMQSLNLQDALQAMGQLKRQLISKGEATELFGQLRGDGLASALGTIEQGFADELFYPNIASRAANLLYFVIKNHPLADGNKRTGSFLFLWYLRINQHLLAKPVEQLINDNTLVALALLIAESKADQKELMIRLVEHFILLKPRNLS
jgi:prophage maintenance system killer protein